VAARFRYFDEGFKKSSLSNTNLKREDSSPFYLLIFYIIA